MTETTTDLKPLLFLLKEEDLLEFEVAPTNREAFPVVFFPQHENRHVYHWHSFPSKKNKCQMEQIPLGPSFTFDKEGRSRLALFCRECGLRFVIPNRILSQKELSEYLVARGAETVSTS